MAEYNIADGGQGIVLSGQNNPMFGKTHSDETRRKISEKLQGHQPTQGFTGLRHANESKRKMSKTHKKLEKKYFTFLGKHHNQDTKEKIRSAKLAKNNPNARAVINLDTNEVFDCMKTCRGDLQCMHKSISSCCNGRKDSVKGYHWKYYDEVNLSSAQIIWSMVLILR